MRNREKLSKMAQIDLLYSMAENRLRSPVKGPCILFLLDPWNCNIGLDCPKKLPLDGISVSKDREVQLKKCYDCIAKYLNMDMEKI